MTPRIQLSEAQVAEFRRIWFIYGNGGKKSTMGNHKLIQGFYEYGEDRRGDYKNMNAILTEKHGADYAAKHGITDECLQSVEKILSM